MKLSKREYKALTRWLGKQPMTMGGARLRYAVFPLNPEKTHADMKSLGKGQLELLVAKLPSGIGSPQLRSVSNKASVSLAGLRQPHLDPDSYPQAYRMMTRLNNARAGIRKGPAGQYLRLNPKAMSVRLKGAVTWDETNGGDLHIMGTWAEISKMIADGGNGLKLKTDFEDIYAGDVNVEHDRMYGSMPGDVEGGVDALDDTMPLYVSLQAGALWKKSDKEGEVVLNAPKEIIELVVGRGAGVGGQIPAATIQSVTLDTIGTVGPTLYEGGKKLVGMMTVENPDKCLYTITVGLGPVGKRYRGVDTGVIDGPRLLAIAEQLRRSEA